MSYLKSQAIWKGGRYILYFEIGNLNKHIHIYIYVRILSNHCHSAKQFTQTYPDICIYRSLSIQVTISVDYGCRRHSSNPFRSTCQTTLYTYMYHKYIFAQENMIDGNVHTLLGMWNAVCVFLSFFLQ